MPEQAPTSRGQGRSSLKPGNILLDEDGNAYLTDFGIAKVVGDTTESGTITGSLAYLSPEQIRAESATPQSDIYSLGVTLYEALVGEHPFAGSTTSEMISRHLRDPLPTMRVIRLELPEGIDAVIQCATDKDADRRYADVVVPGTQPLANLTAALLTVAPRPLDHLSEQLQADVRGLLWAAESILANTDGDLLLFIDQFEEIFTLVEDEAERAHFLESLRVAVTDAKSRLRVIIALRADFYDRPLLYDGFGALIQQRTQVVLPLTGDAIERAITGPAKRTGLQVDSEVRGDRGDHLVGSLPPEQDAPVVMSRRQLVPPMGKCCTSW